MNKLSYINTIYQKYPELQSIIKHIARAQGIAYLVGGAVRSLILDAPIKDIDIEVHNLELTELITILKNYGTIKEVGASFGVIKLQTTMQSDWSLPRTDSYGRKPQVTIDPFLTIDQALRRRDLTINAMALNLMSGTLHDPFNGAEHIKKKLLECTDPNSFIEDPLRLFRVMQFIGRFDMTPSKQLSHLCSRMSLQAISVERIEQEFIKLFLQSRQPSQGIRWLKKIGRLQQILPELFNTIGIQQSPQWHPEGDVFEHTMQVIDAAAQEVQQLPLKKDRLTIFYGALCHDLGKVSTTKITARGAITSRGHESAGVGLAQALMKRICTNKTVVCAVKKLVQYHMVPAQFIANNTRLSRYKILACTLAPETNCYMLALLATADKRGRNSASHEPLFGPIESSNQFIEQAKLAGVLYAPKKAILTGKDIIDYIQPGPQLGKFLKAAYAIQINENIENKQELMRRTLQLIKKNSVV